MSDWLPLIAAFTSGLFGGVHCIGMCGGIVSAISLNLPRAGSGHPFDHLGQHLAYNLGRITSYSLAGAIFGTLGLLLVGWLPLRLAQGALLMAAGVFMLLLGLYLANLWRALAVLERAGTRVWRRIEPLGRSLLPIRSPRQAFVVGLVWGWIPCGLVYAMLINATATGSPLGGAAVMLVFGLGTLPNLLGMGLLAGAAAHLARSPAARRVAGIVVILLGLVTLVNAVRLIR